MNFCVTKMFDSLIKRKKYIKAEKKFRSYATVNINSKNLNESAKNQDIYLMCQSQNLFCYLNVDNPKM